MADHILKDHSRENCALCIVGSAHLYGMCQETELAKKFHLLTFDTTSKFSLPYSYFSQEYDKKEQQF